MPAPCKPPPGSSQPMAGTLPSRPRRHHVRLRGLGEGHFADGGAGVYSPDGSLAEGGPSSGVDHHLRRRIQGRPGAALRAISLAHLLQRPGKRRFRPSPRACRSGAPAGRALLSPSPSAGAFHLPALPYLSPRRRRGTPSPPAARKRCAEAIFPLLHGNAGSALSAFSHVPGRSATEQAKIHG